MSDRRQSAFTAVRQIQQMQLVQQPEVRQHEVIHQSQVMIEQPQSQMDMQMLSDASTMETAQHLHSLDPTSTINTFGAMRNPMVWPSQQQQDHTQTGKQTNGWNPEHVQFIQKDNSQFMQYNGQTFLPRRIFSHSTPGAIQVMPQEKVLSFPTKNVALPTATNQGLVVHQLDAINNWPTIKHNIMHQDCVIEKPVHTNDEIFQYSPLQQYNASIPQRFAWAPPQFPPLLDCVPNHSNLLKSLGPMPDNQQQVQYPGYRQNDFQQHYGQTVGQTSESVLETVGEMVDDDAANSVIKSRYVDAQPNTVALPTGMENNRQADSGVSDQHDEQQQNGDGRDHSVVLSVVTCSSPTSTTRPFSPESQKSESMPLVIMKPGKSFKTSIVPVHETLTAETAKSVSSNGDIAKNKTALIKPQMYTDVIEDIVFQESRRPFSKISMSDSPGVYNSVQDGKNVTLGEPMRKKIKLDDATGQGNIQMENEYIDEKSLDCEIMRNSVSNTSSSDVGLNHVQKQKVLVSLPSELTFKKLMTWTVEDVHKLMVLMVDCFEIAAKFEYHEIDGHALTLLKLVHLVEHMGIKFGPALKLLSKINEVCAKIKNIQSCPHVLKYKPTES